MSALGEVQWLVQLYTFSQAPLPSYSLKPKTLTPHYSVLTPHYSITLFDVQDKFVKNYICC